MGAQDMLAQPPRCQGDRPEAEDGLGQADAGADEQWCRHRAHWREELDHVAASVVVVLREVEVCCREVICVYAIEAQVVADPHILAIIDDRAVHMPIGLPKQVAVWVAVIIGEYDQRTSHGYLNTPRPPFCPDLRRGRNPTASRRRS